MGVFDVTIQTFECYNQPLNENPNTADLIGPALISMQRGEDFMEHVKLTLIAILGRKDLHKFQNIIEGGEAPSFELPEARFTMAVEPTANHLSSIPAGGNPIVSKVGNLQILDWVNYWMFGNSPYPYRPCPYGPTMDQDNYNDGYSNSYVIGVVYNADKSGYHVVVVVELGGAEQTLETRIVEDVTIPLAPDGYYDIVYYSMGLMEFDEDGDGSVASNAVCEGIADPGQRKEAAGGFVWKPESEARPGQAAVLFPEGSPGGAASIQGIEVGDYRGLTNGGRPTTYFSKSGSEYPPNITVCTGTDGSESGGIGSSEIEMCGVNLIDSNSEVSFGEEDGRLVVFPPIPIRVNNENYYNAFDNSKQNDIERLSSVFEIKAKRLIEEIMESEGVAGNEEKVDDVYINYGARIHDNSSANCKYLYLFFDQVYEYMTTYGNGPSSCTGDASLFGLGSATESGIYCNLFTIRSGDFYYEFGFTSMDSGSANLSEILGDENLAEQYEDRKRRSRPWYISSSEGDGSAGEDYEQPESGSEYLEELIAGEVSGEHSITFYKCEPSGAITKVTVIGFNARTRVTDNDTNVTKLIQFNPEDPNGILVPYVPAIGEQLKNHELADCFLTSLHVSIYVADIETKSLPWWVAVLYVVLIVLAACTGYGGAIGKLAADAIVGMVVSLLIGYMIGKMVTGIATQYGAGYGLFASMIAAVLVAIATRGMSLMQLASGAIESLAAMSLKDILLTALNVVSKVTSIVTAGETGEASDQLAAGAELYQEQMLELANEREEFYDESGGFVGIEPLLDNLLDTSVRTEVNPMSPDAYFDMYDNFHNIGTNLIETDHIFEGPFDMDGMLQPA